MTTGVAATCHRSLPQTTSTAFSDAGPASSHLVTSNTGYSWATGLWTQQMNNVHVHVSLWPCFTCTCTCIYMCAYHASYYVVCLHSADAYLIQLYMYSRSQKKSTFRLRTVFITVCIFITVAITVRVHYAFLSPFVFSLPLQLPCACIIRLHFPLFFYSSPATVAENTSRRGLAE